MLDKRQMKNSSKAEEEDTVPQVFRTLTPPHYTALQNCQASKDDVQDDLDACLAGRVEDRAKCEAGKRELEKQRADCQKNGKGCEVSSLGETKGSHGGLRLWCTQEDPSWSLCLRGALSMADQSGQNVQKPGSRCG